MRRLGLAVLLGALFAGASLAGPLGDGTGGAGSGGSGGTGGHIIQDEAGDLTNRARLNFTGAGISCADNLPQSRTDCTVAGAAGGPPSFDTITTGTNTAATMTIGTGASIVPSGGGVIRATDVACTDCTALASETTGNYVASVGNGTCMSGGAAGSEAAALTLAFDQACSPTLTGAWDFGGARIEVQNATTLPTGDCDAAAETGRIGVDTDAPAGQKFYVCTGGGGWELQADGVGLLNAYSTVLGDTGTATAAGATTLAIVGNGAQTTFNCVNGSPDTCSLSLTPNGITTVQTGPDSCDAECLSSSAIQAGDIEDADVPATITRDTEVPGLETDPGVPLLSLADYGTVCGASTGVQRNAGNTANECVNFEEEGTVRSTPFTNDPSAAGQYPRSTVGLAATWGLIQDTDLPSTMTRDTEVPGLETDPGVPFLTPLVDLGDIGNPECTIVRNTADNGNICAIIPTCSPTTHLLRWNSAAPQAWECVPNPGAGVTPDVTIHAPYGGAAQAETDQLPDGTCRCWCTGMPYTMNLGVRTVGYRVSTPDSADVVQFGRYVFNTASPGTRYFKAVLDVTTTGLRSTSNADTVIAEPVGASAGQFCDCLGMDGPGAVAPDTRLQAASDVQMHGIQFDINCASGVVPATLTIPTPVPVVSTFRPPAIVLMSASTTTSTSTTSTSSTTSTTT